jgi:hypothetical protein
VIWNVLLLTDPIASGYEQDFENVCHLHRHRGCRFIDGRRRYGLHGNDQGTGGAGTSWTYRNDGSYRGAGCGCAG